MTVLDGNYTNPTYTNAHGGLPVDPKIPDAMEGFIAAGLKALEHGDKIPKKLVKACAGVVLLEAGEGGIVISMQGGNGVALQHKDGKWSNPVAVNILSVGGGAVFGYANKCVIVLLNHFAMDRLLEGNGSFNIGVDAGFAVGKTGRAASADIEISNKGGLGTSLIYTYSQGIMFSVQAVIGGRINPPDAPNEKFYGTSNYPDILEGKVSPPEGSKVPELLTKLAEFENGPDDTSTVAASEEGTA